MNILKNKQKFLVIFASFITFVGNGMHAIGISWLLFDLTKSSTAVGILITLEALPSIFISPFAGVLADRYNKKLLAIGMDLFRFILALLIPIFHMFGTLHLWQLYMIPIFLTIGSNLFFPAFSGLIKTSFSEDEYIHVISANGVALQLGMILGAGFAGLIVTKLSIYTVFYINALTYIASALCLLLLKANKVAQSSIGAQHTSVISDIKDGIKYIMKNNLLVYLISLGLISSSVINSLNTLLSSYVSRTLHSGINVYGFLDATFAVGSVVMGMILSVIRTKLSTQRIVQYSFLIMGIGMVILGVSMNTWVSAIALLIIGASSISETSSRKGLIMMEVDSNYIGRVESLNWAIYSSVAPLFAVLSGIVADKVNDRIIFFIFAILLAGIFLNMSRSMKKSNKFSKIQSDGESVCE